MRLALALLLLLLAPALPAASEVVPAEDPHAGDLFENEFSVLDLFKGIQELRPRFRLSEEMVVRQPYRGAEIDSFELGFRAQVAFPVTDSLALRLSGRMEATLFDFHGDRDFLDTGRPSGDPFDELLSNGFVLEGRYALREDWAFISGGSYESSWERGARYADGIDLAGFFGVAHIFRDTVSILAAARVSGSPGDSGVSWSPIVRIGWRVTEDLEIESQELGLRVAARVHPRLTIFLSGRRAGNSYALEDRGGSLGKATLRSRSVPVILGASWRISKRWRLRGNVGAIAYQKYVVRDRDGDTVDKARSDGPAFTGRAHLEYRF